MNGNITKEGIKRDLEWMKRVGIGGFQNFDAALCRGQGRRQAPRLHDAGVEGRLLATPPTLADQLGLEEAIAGSPGWSESGGPWVQPAQAMKKLVWSETRVAGGDALHRQAREATNHHRAVSERADHETCSPR